MNIVKEYRKLDDIEEVHVYALPGDEFYIPAPREFDVEEVPFPELLSNIPMDIHILVPYNDGEDFIIHGLGNVSIKRGNFSQEDVKGRLLSKVSPVFNEILYDSLFETYKSHILKKVRFFYYLKDKLLSVTNTKIMYEMGRIFVLTDYTDTSVNNFQIVAEKPYDEDKSNMIEYFSQTGSFNKVDGNYFWSQGIYNIINRPREESDKFYNIVFDLVVPEDRPLVDNIINVMDGGETQFEDEIRIKTIDGNIKTVEVSLYSNFDENGDLISVHGLMNDVTHYSKITRPVDFLLNGFKNSKKLALLIEPLSVKQFEFSEGFYHLIECDPQDYVHSRDIIYNIVERETIDNIIKLADGELDEVDETFTYDAGGSEKICELYIERFEFGDEIHSIGFLTDISEEKRKQNELIKSNEHQKVLIKEVHHRVKNNLQVLNSFLNLEKRVYRNNYDIIINHMQSRLTSLALLHEKTYNAIDFKNINLKDYIEDQDTHFKSLLNLKNDIEFVTEIDESLSLSIEVITPLSLVINELTMNSIKHAFPDDSSSDKKIIKEITKIDDNWGKLIIRDNGVGIEDKGNIVNNLGCEIVKSLTRQLDGKIRLLDFNEGIGYELLFPLTMEHTITQ